jgi:hypothetical protein
MPSPQYLYSPTSHRCRERAGNKGTGYEWDAALFALNALFPHSFPVPFFPANNLYLSLFMLRAADQKIVGGKNFYLTTVGDCGYWWGSWKE